MTERLPFHFSLSCIGEGNGNPLQCSCLENPRDRGAWWASVYGVAQSRTRLKRLSSSKKQMVVNLPTMWETWVRSLGREHPLEEGTATHSSTLDWRIPWTEEPGRLQSVGSQRAGHDWVTKHSTARNRNRLTDIGTDLWSPRGRGDWGGKDRKFGINRCKSLYIWVSQGALVVKTLPANTGHVEWIKNKVLLHSTGNYI